MDELGGNAGELIRQGAALEQVKTEYHTAVRVQVKRDLNEINEAIKTEAELAGSSFYYSWPVQKKLSDGKYITIYIEGPSVGLTRSAARNFKNCAVEVSLAETDSTYIFRGRFIDVESGVTVTRLFRQSKEKNIGSKYEKDRAEDMIFQIGQSKALRNVIREGIPKWIIDNAMEAAINAVNKGITEENVKEKREIAFAYFETKGIPKKRVLDFLRKDEGYVKRNDILFLGGLKSRIEDGEPAESVFFVETVEEKTENKINKLKENLNAAKGKAAPPTTAAPAATPAPAPETPVGKGAKETEKACRNCGILGYRGFKKSGENWLCSKCSGLAYPVAAKAELKPAGNPSFCGGCGEVFEKTYQPPIIEKDGQPIYACALCITKSIKNIAGDRQEF